MKDERSRIKVFLWLSPVILIASLMGLSACGGGSSGGGTASSSAPPATSSTSSSGAMGVYMTNGAANAAVPAASSGGSSQGEIVTLPNSGTLTASVSISSAQFQALNLPALGVSSVNGLNVDSTNNLGAAFSFSSNSLSFFSLSTYKQVGSYTCNTSCSSVQVFSGATPTIGGVVMFPANKWAIFSTGGGFEIVSYATPSSPSKVKLIPGDPASSDSPSNFTANGKIIMTENFAFDPSLNVGGSAYAMILAGGYNSFELADINTGTIYIPDSSTTSSLSGLSSCGVDQIGVDTSYQVAVLGCEDSNNAYILDLNQLTLNTTAGTYTLPTTAIKSIPLPGNEIDNVAVESTNHLVFIGGGGYGMHSGAFFAGQLQNPKTSLGFVNSSGATSLVSMPVSSPSNTANCSVAAGCTPIPTGTSWLGWTDPHSNGAFLDAGGNSMVLWENNAQNAIAVINLTALQKNSWNPACNPNCNIWYQGIP